MVVPIELLDRDSHIKSVAMPLNNKVVTQYSSLFAPLLVDVVLSVINPSRPDLVDLRDVKIVKKLGGTVGDTELKKGLIFDKRASHSAGGPPALRTQRLLLFNSH